MGFFEIFFENNWNKIFLFASILIFVAGICFRRRNKFEEFVQYVPSLLTSLGIFGTFVGIVYGLYDFDAYKIDESIPVLLEGLKTAFYTSIVGMFFAIAFKLIMTFMPRSAEAIKQEFENDPAAYDTFIALEQTKCAALQISSVVDEIKETGASREKKLDDIAAMLSSEEEGVAEILRKILKYMQQTEEEKLDKFNEFKTELRGDLEKFSDQMSKSATSQIIDALRQVILDFNANLTEQFGENFKQLNEAVGELVVWQDKYRLQLIDLEDRYKTALSQLEMSRQAVESIAENCRTIPSAMSSLQDVVKIQDEQIQILDSHMNDFALARDKALEAVPSIREAVDEALSSLEKTSESLVGVMNESAELISNNSDSIKDQTKAFNEALSATADEFAGTALNMTQTVIQSVQNSSEMLLKSAVDAVEESGKKITQAASDSIKPIVESMESAAEETGRKIEETADEVSKTTEQLNRAFEKAASSIEMNINKLDEGMTQELNNALEELGSALGTIAQEVGRGYRKATEGNQ